jgi:hypothetical protein
MNDPAHDRFKHDASMIVALIIVLFLAVPVGLWLMHHGPGYATVHHPEGR